MKDFVNYIEDSCKDIKDSATLYKYKKKMLDTITERADEITHSGLTDNDVLYDLIACEYPDIKGGYEKFAEEEKKKKRASFMRKLIAIHSVAYFILTFVVYFAVSFITKRWDVSWLIIIGGIFSLIIYLVSFIIRRLCKMKRIFHPIARALTAGCIMLFTVFVFLFCLMLVPMSEEWTVIPAGLIVLFIADSIFAHLTRQKFAIINYFLYIPASFALLYVILGAYNIVPWSPGWLMVLLGVAVDLIIAAGIVMSNMRYTIHSADEEDYD